MKATPIALRWLLADLRGGELSIILTALILSTATVASVGFLTERVELSLGSEARALLAADLVVSADRPLDPALAAEARARGLVVARTLTFPSMVQTSSDAQLVSLRAVDGPYPLRGELWVRAGGRMRTTTAAPARGTVWLDEVLAARLELTEGATVELGDSSFTVAGWVVREPDVPLDMSMLTPRVLMHAGDLLATGLDQPSSRIRHRLLLAGPAPDIRALAQWLEPRLLPGQRLEDPSVARPQLRSAIERATRFLGLSALLSVFMGAAAIALAARRYTERHLDAVAMLRTFGWTQRQISALFLQQFVVLGGLGTTVGAALGWLGQLALLRAVAALFEVELPAATAWPALTSAAIGLTLLFGFVWPPLVQLRGVPPLRVLRREVEPSGGSIRAALLGAATLAALLYAQARDPRLAGLVGAAVLAVVLIGGAAALLLVWLVPRLATFGDAAVRYGVANLRRRRGLVIAQIVALSLGLMVLMLLTVVRTDLLAEWQKSIPTDAPNHFILNIQPEQREPLAEALRALALPVPELSPMVRGRLASAGTRTATSLGTDDPDTKQLVEREFNLSWSDGFAPGEPAWSVERGMAERLELSVGDTLAFTIDGQTYTAPIRELRDVKWDSFRVNFFVVGSRALLAEHPTSYITSLHLPAERRAVSFELTKRFPNLTVVDVSKVMAEVRTIIERVMLAVELIFLFSLCSGLVVLYAAALATEDERRREVAVLRALGVSRRTVSRAASAELWIIGGLAGLVGSTCALVAGAVTAYALFELPWVFDPWLVPLGIVVGGALSRAAATPLLRRVLRTPPREALMG